MTAPGYSLEADRTDTLMMAWDDRCDKSVVSDPVRYRTHGSIRSYPRGTVGRERDNPSAHRVGISGLVFHAFLS